MTECELSRNMPVGAFVVFVGALLIFSYVLFDDYQKTNNQRSNEESMWIFIFFGILIICVLVSGMCIIRSNRMIGKSKMGKKLSKRFDLLKDKFNSAVPNFVGKRRF